MSESNKSRQAVLVVEAEAVFQDLQSQLSVTRYEVILATQPAQARITAGSEGPAVVVIPIPGGDAIQARSLRGVLPSTSFIVGLVEEGDSPEPPEGVDRVARLKDRIGILASVELLLSESAKAQEEGVPASSVSGLGAVNAEFDEAVGEPGAGAKGEPSEESEDADVDPGRTAAIRELGMAIRMERSMGGGQPQTPTAAPGISLGHGDRHDPSKVDIGVGGSVGDALSALPDPSKAVSAEEHREQLQRERDAAAQRAALAQIRSKKDATEELSELDLGVEVRKSRKGLIIGIVVGVLILAAAGAGWHFYRGYRAKQKAEAAKKPKYHEKYDDILVSRAQRAAKRGVLVDPFAGLIAQTREGVRPTDVDESDEFLNRSVPELDRWFELALKRLSPRRAREQLILRAGPLVKFEQWRRAQRFLYRAIKIKDGVDVRELMAQTFEKQNKAGAAIYHLKRAVKLKPRRADLRVRLGKQYLAKKSVKKACREFKAAAKRKRSHRDLVKAHCAGGGK